MVPQLGTYLGQRGWAFFSALDTGFGSTSNQRGEGDDEPLFDPEKVNPQATAKEMIRWKRLGDRLSNNKGGLAGAAIGAATAIDQQVSAQTSRGVLTDLNLDAVGRELESGELKGGGVEIASQALDSYAEGLDTLLDDDFFGQIR